jgi:hypothetical protein
VSNEIEAGGALATAALAADALQPAAAGPAPHGASCANCGAALAGPFCGQCGQRAHLHRSIGEVVHEVVHGVTHFDGRFWTTLPMLLFRPGQLIRSYVDGQRARYIAPVPLFLMVVFLMFFVLSFVGFNDNVGEVQVGSADPKQNAQALSQALADIDRDIAAARAKNDTAEVQRLEGARGVVQALGRQAGPGEASISDRLADEIAAANARGDAKINFGLPWLDEKARAALKNPKLFLYKLQTKAYKLSFLLVPLSLPWLWLVFFWRRRDNGAPVTVYEHAIFALYSISFMSLLFVAGSLLLSANIVTQFVWVPLTLAPAVHMFAALRGAYALGWWEAGWRTAYLSIAGMMNLSAYLVILIVLGVVD